MMLWWWGMPICRGYTAAWIIRMAQAAPFSCEEKVRRLIEAKPDAIGIALILANDYKCQDAERKGFRPLEGPMKDAQVAEKVFGSLETICYTLHNESSAVTLAACKAVANYNYHSSIKWIVVIFAGHGETNEEIVCQDGEKLNVQSIINQYDPEKTPHNAKIPKIFLFDACRGKEVTKAVFVPRGDGKPEEYHQIPRGGMKCDMFRMPFGGNMLIAYSTQPNSQAFECKGGLWLSTLLDRIQVNNSSITDILNDVNKDVVCQYKDNALMQLPEYKSTLLGNVNFVSEVKTKCLKESLPDKSHIEIKCPEEPPSEKDNSKSHEELLFEKGYTQELNRLIKNKQRKYIDTEGGHVTLIVTLDDNTEVEFKSQNYQLHFRHINEARECVARMAVKLIEQQQQSLSTSVIKASPPISPREFYGRSNSRSNGQSGDPAPVQLKNLIVDYYKQDKPPEYTDEEEKPVSGPKKYRSTVTHSMLKEGIVGSWCKSKKDAKISAATKALAPLNKNTN